MIGDNLRSRDDVDAIAPLNLFLLAISKYQVDNVKLRSIVIVAFVKLDFIDPRKRRNSLTAFRNQLSLAIENNTHLRKSCFGMSQNCWNVEKGRKEK